MALDIVVRVLFFAPLIQTCRLSSGDGSGQLPRGSRAPQLRSAGQGQIAVRRSQHRSDRVTRFFSMSFDPA